MKTINDALDGLKAVAGKAERERSDRAAEIRRRIEEGESTGDAILDFLAWMWPAGHEEALPHYRALSERLEGKKGQFVLMIERGQESVGGCMPSLGPPVHETFSLGVLSDDKLRLERVERGKLSFPTGRHAVHGAKPFYGDGVREGDLCPRFYDTIFWRKTEPPMEIRYQDGGGCFGGGGIGVDFCLGAERDKHMTELEFVIGDAEIDAWCRRGAMHCKKDSPNDQRCEMIAGLASHLGASAGGIPAIRVSTKAQRKKIRADIEARVSELKSAMDELYAEDDPRDPSGLVKRIRSSRREIRGLLDEAERLGMDDHFLQRLRAAHPRRQKK